MSRLHCLSDWWGLAASSRRRATLQPLKARKRSCWRSTSWPCKISNLRRPSRATRPQISLNTVRTLPAAQRQLQLIFLSKLIARSPQPKWEVVRAIAEGDLVFVHARYIAGAGAPEIAIAEIFRVRDGKLAEHWDVISGPPDKVVNPNSRF